MNTGCDEKVHRNWAWMEKVQPAMVHTHCECQAGCVSTSKGQSFMLGSLCSSAQQQEGQGLPQVPGTMSTIQADVLFKALQIVNI